MRLHLVYDFANQGINLGSGHRSGFLA